MARSRESYEQIQAYERLSEWQTSGPDGTPQTLTGPQGLEAMRVSHARLESENAMLGDLFRDPARFASFLVPHPDDPTKLAIDPTQLRMFALEAKFTGDTAESKIRARIGELKAPKPAPAVPASIPDVSSHAPAIILNAAGPHAAKLTDTDKRELEALVPRMVRAVTHEDRITQPHLALGSPIIDSQLRQIVQNRIALRDEMAKSSTASASAAAENARRLAAAANGVRPITSAPVLPAARAPVSPTSTVPSMAQSQDEKWDIMERLASGGR